MKTPRLLCAASLAFALVVASVQAQTLSYPETRKVEQTDAYFGTAVADPYRWLEDDNAADTKAWVEAQNKVTFGYLEKIPYRDAVKKRLLGLVNYPRYGQPSGQVRDGCFSPKTAVCKTRASSTTRRDFEGTPDVFLDPNSFSEDGTARLAGFAVSKNGKYAAYGISRNGSDWS